MRSYWSRTATHRSASPNDTLARARLGVAEPVLASRCLTSDRCFMILVAMTSAAAADRDSECVPALDRHVLRPARRSRRPRSRTSSAGKPPTAARPATPAAPALPETWPAFTERSRPRHIGGLARGQDLWLEPPPGRRGLPQPELWLYVVENVRQGDPEQFRLLQIGGQRRQAMLARAVERRYFGFPGTWQPTTNSSATSISLRKLPLWVRANRLRQDLRRAAFAPANAMIGGSRPEQRHALTTRSPCRCVINDIFAL